MKKRKEKYAFMINSLQLGGAERVVQTIVNELCAQYEVHLITLEGVVLFELDDRVVVHNLDSWPIKKNKFIKVLLLVLLALRLKRYLKKNGISVVQSNLFRANYVNIMARLFGGMHCVIIVDHTLPERLYNEGLSGKINIFLIRTLYRYAEVSVSVSSKVCEQLTSIASMPIRKYVINNPFDLNSILSKSKESVDDFNYTDNSFYLISVGRINSIKRHDLIIKALNLLNNENIYLVIIGKEEDVSVSDLLDMSDNNKNISFLGEKSNPYKYIRNSNALILSSDSESFGNVLVESMICGTPTISTKCGGPEDIIEDCVNGVLVELNNVAQLADAINKLVVDRGFVRMLVCNAFLSAKKYELGNVVVQYKKLLETCV